MIRLFIQLVFLIIMLVQVCFSNVFNWNVYKFVAEQVLYGGGMRKQHKLKPKKMKL